MATADAEVHGFIAALTQLSDTKAFAATFEHFVKKFGCRYFVISGIPDGSASLEDLLVIHNLPEDWVDEYLDRNYIMIDPIVRRCTVARDPFFWREAIQPNTSAESQRVMARAESYGLRNGVCFPIHNINGFEAGISLSGFDAPPKATEVRSLHLASIMAFNTLRRIRSDHSLRVQGISEREKEVLTWSALGKTSKEIAYILFVAENTVNVHIKNAIGKLSAKNKTEAVTIAVRQGIISI